jgi:fluoroquinolone resistance protein
MMKYWVEEKTFTNIDYSGQRLQETEYDSCIFINCDFSETNFHQSQFLNCKFENCNFSNAVCPETGMKQVQFTGCKLIGMAFLNCSDLLFSVSFQKCTLDYSTFSGKKMKKTIFTDCSLQEVDFSDCDLSMAVFKNCDLYLCVFQNTNLENADFRSARNYTIDPENNRIRKAKFSYSGISGLLYKYQIEIE